MSTQTPQQVGDDLLSELREVVEKHWGYRTFRPMQEEAMAAMLQARDSLVVLPTGGGKSLCYQAPAVVRSLRGWGPTVVVSPLIALMKDQVDSLHANGVMAAQLDSSLSSSERSGIVQELRDGGLKMLFVSPERLVMPAFQDMLRDAGVTCFAIDEAHCISHWGHDFRPEYRQISRLKEWFPGASVHGFTATATEQVRADIIEQLGLEQATVLVGNFDRRNLVYRVEGRRNELAQVIEVLDRHKNEAGIIYCIRRKDVDELTASLKAKGFKAMAYHAGMTPDQRKKAQEAFTGRGKETCDLIVATVAFGMGIDRSDIRFVMHTGMPKSVEAYQQETGRAGRDSLEAECVLLYSGADFMSWKGLIERSAADAVAAGTVIDPDYVSNAVRHLDDMDRYCRGAMCRHQVLVEYFGQVYEDSDAERPADAATGCGACDLCLGETEPVPDALVIAQKILSAVARVGERFGVGHVIGVLRGAKTEQLKKWGHDKLTTYGLLAAVSEGELRDFIYQLISQKVLVQDKGEYPVLKLNPASWEVMRKQRDVRLVQPVRKTKEEKTRKSKTETISWEGVDQDLFETLRGMRREVAADRGVPPYVIFSDATLRELARVRPSTLERMRLVYGIGETKLRDFGPRVLPMILNHCQAKNLPFDNNAPAPSVRKDEPKKMLTRPNEPKEKAYKMFRTGASIDEVAAAIGRARPTVAEYLCDWIRTEHPDSVGAWVTDRVYQQVQSVAKQVGLSRIKPIFIGLGEQVDYDTIRIVVTHMEGA